jgi:hypothetical protein
VAATAGFRIVLEAHGSGVAELTIRPTCADGSSSALARVQIEAAGSPRSLSWSVLSTSGEAEKVLRGRDGWMFLRSDSNDVIGQHTGLVKISADDLAAWSDVFERRHAVVRELGATWLCAVIPDKESVYPEQLPAELELAAARPVHDVLAVADRVRAPVVHLLPDLEAAKPSGLLYPLTDTHWNHRGAHVAYRRICGELAARGAPVDPLDDGEIEWFDELYAGDLGIKIHPDPVKSPMTRAKLPQHRGRVVFDNGIRNHGHVLIFEREDLDSTCVVFGESFVENLLIFLKESFGRLVVVHTSMFVREIVEAEQADVVLSLPLERFMVRVPDDRGSFSALAEIARKKGGSLPWPAGGRDR